MGIAIANDPSIPLRLHRAQFQLLKGFLTRYVKHAFASVRLVDQADGLFAGRIGGRSADVHILGNIGRCRTGAVGTGAAGAPGGVDSEWYAFRSDYSPSGEVLFALGDEGYVVATNIIRLGAHYAICQFEILGLRQVITNIGGLSICQIGPLPPIGDRCGR